MEIKLVPGSEPFMPKPRQYSREQRKVLVDFMRNAIDYRCMRKNKNAIWAFAPLLVPKSTQNTEEKRYRVAFELCAVNYVTITQP